MLDFLLLMCVSRQQRVFNIEKQNEGRVFAGGSNRTVIGEINRLSTGCIPIETHDFVTFTRNWLDVLKCAIFFGSFWITLAILLKAGTHCASILSLGYLIASFIFSYQGSNFYMRPIYTILSWWKMLIRFNIFVIVLKTILNLHLAINSSTSGLADTAFGKLINISSEVIEIIVILV